MFQVVDKDTKTTSFVFIQLFLLLTLKLSQHINQYLHITDQLVYFFWYIKMHIYLWIYNPKLKVISAKDFKGGV